MRASDKAYEALRTDIVEWRLRPGAVLGEVEQAERLGVSRTPLREALARLVADGLAVQQRGRGAVVSDVSLEHVDDLFALRRALEIESARIAARRAPTRRLRRAARPLPEGRAHREPRGPRVLLPAGRPNWTAASTQPSPTPTSSRPCAPCGCTWPASADWPRTIPNAWPPRPSNTPRSPRPSRHKTRRSPRRPPSLHLHHSLEHIKTHAGSQRGHLNDQPPSTRVPQ